MFSPHKLLGRCLLATSCLTLLVPVSAQAQNAVPARVGQITSLSGNVSYNGAGSGGQWIQAPANYPVTRGDMLFTQAGAKAAIVLNSSRLTLGANTELPFLSGLPCRSGLSATDQPGRCSRFRSRGASAAYARRLRQPPGRHVYSSLGHGGRLFGGLFRPSDEPGTVPPGPSVRQVCADGASANQAPAGRRAAAPDPSPSPAASG